VRAMLRRRQDDPDGRSRRRAAGGRWSRRQPAFLEKGTWMKTRIVKTLIACSALMMAAGLGASAALAEPPPTAAFDKSPYFPAVPPLRGAVAAAPLPSRRAVSTVALAPAVGDPTGAAGFSWSSAALGAIATAVLGLVAIGVAASVSRRKGQP